MKGLLYVYLYYFITKSYLVEFFQRLNRFIRLIKDQPIDPTEQIMGISAHMPNSNKTDNDARSVEKRFNFYLKAFQQPELCNNGSERKQYLA